MSEGQVGREKWEAQGRKDWGAIWRPNSLHMTALESFWETFDRDGVGDHPLMRELCDRLDALTRCQAMIDDAEVAGNDEAVEILSAQFNRHQDSIRRIRNELTRVGVTY